MIVGRDYQVEAVQSLYKYFETHKSPEENPVIAMPTGTGKSVVIALFLQSIYRMWGNQRVMVLTHVMELIQQNYEKLITLWPFAPAGVYSASLNRRDTHALITFGGIGSVAKKASLFGFINLLIIDEVHLVSPEEATQYRYFIAALRAINPFLRVVGLTATPWRMGQGRIIDPYTKRGGEEVAPLFTDICIDLTTPDCFNRFIAEGYLLPPVPKKTETFLDTDGVHMRGGDFIGKELEVAINKEEITKRAVEEAIAYGANRQKWLVFASGVDHAIDTAEIMCDMGIPTVAIHGKMSRQDRVKAINDYKAGRYLAATNNNILTTGFDFPAIDLIMMLRPTMSTVLWVQMIGRGTRPLFAPGFDLSTIDGRLQSIAASPKQDCLVLDYAKNSKSLGPIDDPVIPRARGKGSGEAPIKECPSCGGYVHASLRFCNGKLQDGRKCTHEFIFDTKLNSTSGTDVLLKGELPIVEVFKVDTITYSTHTKHDRPDAMRVSYFCGLRSFDEYICLEHVGYASKKARDWWKERGQEPVPTCTEDALERVRELKEPTHLRVWVNQKFPQIMSVCYDGTAWGTVEKVSGPKVIVMSGSESDLVDKTDNANAFSPLDDDIPF